MNDSKTRKDANRRQASLFLPDVPHIDLLRHRFNPMQAKLIPAHITLCREDEVWDWDALAVTLNTLCPVEMTLNIGNPVRVDNFVYLPVLSEENAFHAFRRALLGKEPRPFSPHVTIIHPRNGTCTDQVFDEISQAIQPFRSTFREVMLIEQQNGGVWTIKSQHA